MQRKMPSDSFTERIAWCLLILIVLVGVTIFLIGLFILSEVYLVLFASIIPAFTNSSSKQNRDEIFLWCWAVVHLPIVLVIVILVAKVYFGTQIYEKHPFLSWFLFGLMLTVLHFAMYYLPHGLTLFSEWFTLAGDLSNVETTRSQQSRYTMSLLAMLVIIGIVIKYNKIVKVCKHLRNKWTFYRISVMLKKEDVLLKHNAIVRTADIKFAESFDVTSIPQISKRVTNDAEIKDDLLKVTMNEQESTNDSQVAKETGEKTNQIDRAESSPPLESNERVTNDAKIKDDLLKVTINEQESTNDPQVAKETGENEKTNQINKAESSPQLESNERVTNDAEIKNDLLKVSINEQESPNDPQVAKETGEYEKINQINKAESSPPLESNEFVQVCKSLRNRWKNYGTLRDDDILNNVLTTHESTNNLRVVKETAGNENTNLITETEPPSSSQHNEISTDGAEMSSPFTLYYHVCQARGNKYFTIRFKNVLQIFESQYGVIKSVNMTDVLILHYYQTSPQSSNPETRYRIKVKDILPGRSYSFDIENEYNVPRIVIEYTLSVENTPDAEAETKRFSLIFQDEQKRAPLCCSCDQDNSVKNFNIGVQASNNSTIKLKNSTIKVKKGM